MGRSKRIKQEARHEEPADSDEEQPEPELADPDEEDEEPEEPRTRSKRTSKKRRTSVDDEEEEEEEAPREPPGRRKSKRRDTAADEEPEQQEEQEPEAAAPTQRSRQPRPVSDTLTADDLEEYEQKVKHYNAVAFVSSQDPQAASQGARLLARHVLFHQREKPDQPMRQAELASLVNESKSRGTSTAIIAEAQALLLRELGLELKKIDLLTGRGPKENKTHAYVLRSELPDCLRKHCPQPARLAQQQHALAVIIFRLIDLTGQNVLPEDTMWRLLAQLGLHSDVQHPSFGKPSDTIDLLIKRRYLRFCKDECRGDQGQVVRGFEQGEAAIDEFNRGADLQPFDEEIFAGLEAQAEGA